jgi:O-acetylserine/cysteine efflux transporter
MRPRTSRLWWRCRAVGLQLHRARLAVGQLPPLLLGALRFAISAPPAAVLPHPLVAWHRMAAIAATLFLGQFGFLFCGMQAGMPPRLCLRA